MDRITIFAIAVSVFVGAVGGYWYRGRILLTQEQAAALAVATTPPRVLKLVPGTPPPLP